jgi:hypothetical protein
MEQSITTKIEQSITTKKGRRFLYLLIYIIVEIKKNNGDESSCKSIVDRVAFHDLI